MTGLEVVKASEIITKFKDQISKFAGLTIDEIRNLFDNGVENYLSIQYQKYSFTKTFLYRNAPVDFYQTFFPVKIGDRKRTISTDDIMNFLYNNQFVGIIGQAGSGKTMLMKHIFLTSFNGIFKIPIVIEIRNLNFYEGSFNDYLEKIILENKIAFNNTFMKRLLDKGAFLFLLDGYDEIYLDKKQKITDEIDQFIDFYNNNHFVISSRPGTNVEALPRFCFYHVQPLSVNDITKFIDHQIQYFEDKELIKKIKNLVQLPENIDFITFIQNPLLLSMFILTYADHPELPKFKSTFYYNVYDTLATKHDTITKKGGYQHERQSGLQKDEIVLFLKFFSLQSLFEGKFSFDDYYFDKLTDKIKINLRLKCENDKLLYDLLVSVNIFIRDGNLITFPHKSLQEFFAVTCISSQGEEFKQKVYTQKLNNFFYNSIGAVSNFWDMLVELDKEYFYKLFVIPNTKRALNESGFYENPNSIMVSYNFLIKNRYCHYLRIQKNDEITEAPRLSSRVNLEMNILSMLNNRDRSFMYLTNADIEKNKILLRSLIDDGFLKKSNNPTEPNLRLVNYSELKSEVVYSLLKDSKLNDTILSWFNSVKNKLDQITTELNDEINSKVSFLD